MNKIKLNSIIFLTSMSLGFNLYANPYPVIINTNIKGKYLQEIKEAANEWNKAAGKRIIIIRYFPYVYQLRDDGKSTLKFGNPRKGEAGTTYRTRTYSNSGYLQEIEADIVVKNDLSDKQFFHTVLHELGHAIGLDHSNNPNDIMYPTLGEN
jgi:predicted Zn-dependent protease